MADTRGAPPPYAERPGPAESRVTQINGAARRNRRDQGITGRQLATVTPDRPALGYFLSLPHVKAELERRKWVSRMSFVDFCARSRALRRLVLVHEAVRTGRRLDLVADDLHVLADELAAVPQRRCGGWPLREVA